MSNKLRKATSRLVEEIENGMLVELSSKFEHDLAKTLLANVKSALAEPLKNCEVGTAKAQNIRHCRFCSNAVAECRGGSNYDCLTCFSRWAQRPYRKDKK